MERYTLPTTLPWMEPQLQQDTASWTKPTSEPTHDITISMPAPLISFKSMLQPQPEPQCFLNPFVPNPATTTDNFLMHHQGLNMDSFSLDPSSSLTYFNNNNAFDSGFDLGLDSGFLLGSHSNSPLLTGFSQAHVASDFPELEALSGPGNALFPNRAKAPKPLEAPQPTLFKKRRGSVEIPGLETVRRRWEEGEGEEGNSVGGLSYDSDEQIDNGNSLNPNDTVPVAGGDHKGKKKGLPAKNLMAERRRRKKLNDRLYMLRSVVPKISKV